MALLARNTSNRGRLLLLGTNGRFSLFSSPPPTWFPIEFIGSATNQGGSVTFPEHQSGDLIILYGEGLFGSSLATIDPSAGWTVPVGFALSNPYNIFNGFSTKPVIVAYKFASSNAESFPQFTSNAPTNTTALVYRNVESVTPIPQYSSYLGPNIYFNNVTPIEVTNTDTWILYVHSAFNSQQNPLTSNWSTSRDGFVARTLNYSGSLSAPSSSFAGFFDSNMPTGPVSSVTIATGTEDYYSGFTGFPFVLRSTVKT